MATKLTARVESMPFNPLDVDRPRPAKADLKVNVDQFPLTSIVKDALIQACGSLKSAAISMETDSGQLTRELQAEGPRIGRLGDLPPTERAKVFDRLHEEFGSHAEDPKVRLRREIRELRAKAEAVADLAEEIAS